MSAFRMECYCVFPDALPFSTVKRLEGCCVDAWSQWGSRMEGLREIGLSSLLDTGRMGSTRYFICPRESLNALLCVFTIGDC